MARQPRAGAQNRLPGAAEGRARLRVPASGPLGGDRLSRPARRPCGRARATARADRGRGRARARVRRLHRRLGGRRRRGCRGTRAGRPRRRRARSGRLLVGARLRRRRARRPPASLPRRRRGRDRRPGRGADRRRLPRRGHCRQLHDVLPHSGRRPRGVGGTGLPVGGSRAEPRRGLCPAQRQHRPQPALAARRGDGARARGARLARRRDAARRRRLRAGRRLRFVRLRLPDRREAVDAAHLARGRRRRRSADRGRRKGAARAGRERDGGRRRRRPGPGALPGGRRGRGRDRHTGVAPPLRPDEPERRPRTAAASGDGGLRHLRGGDPAVGGDAAGALLRPVPLPRRRLRRQAGDGAAAPGAAGCGAAVGGSRGARQADGEPAAALTARRDSARRRRRASSDRAQRRGDRDVQAGRGRCAPSDGGDRRRRSHHGGRRRTRDPHRQRSDAALVRWLPGGSVPLWPRPWLAVLVPPDGLGAHGRLAGQFSGIADRRDVGRAQPRDRATARRSRPPPVSTRWSRSRRSRT